MMLTDKPTNYVTRTLSCGHEARVDPVVLEQRPCHAFWCRACATLHPVAPEES